jgi:threonine/homoserine/homoserine lactone efflux protein
MGAYWLFGITFGLAAAWTPGPLGAYLISQSLARGWRRTLPGALSPLVSDGPIAVLVLLVLSQVPPWLERALRLGGGFFLLYLAWEALRSWRTFEAKEPPAHLSGLGGLLKAATVNWLNPHPYLGWSLVLGPLFLKGWREAPANGLALVAGFYGVVVLSLVAMILLASLAGRLGPRLSRALLLLAALGLAAFGVYQLWMAASGGSWGF